MNEVMLEQEPGTGAWNENVEEGGGGEEFCTETGEMWKFAWEDDRKRPGKPFRIGFLGGQFPTYCHLPARFITSNSAPFNINYRSISTHSIG